VIVAVTGVWMMQMVPDTVIGVGAVRHRLVAATRAVDMSSVVTAAAMTGGALIRVFGRYLDHVLVDVALVRMMQVTLVEVIDMARVAHRRVAAAGAMLMCMAGMLISRAGSHEFSSFPFLISLNPAERPVNTAGPPVARVLEAPLLIAHTHLAVRAKRNAG
jgi:hypothetical protein